MALQLVDYIESNGLCEVFQSAYRTNHSTETALIRVYNDIALSIDRRKSVVLVLLDLSAAFDNVDHFFLLSLVFRGLVMPNYFHQCSMLISYLERQFLFLIFG